MIDTSRLRRDPRVIRLDPGVFSSYEGLRQFADTLGRNGYYTGLYNSRIEPTGPPVGGDFFVSVDPVSSVVQQDLMDMAVEVEA